MVRRGGRLIYSSAYLCGLLTYRQQLWTRFRAYAPARWAWRAVRLLVLVALFANVLANDKPLYCVLDGTTYFPAFRQYPVDLGVADYPAGLALADWPTLPYERVVRAPVPYGPLQLDLSNADYVSPFATQRVAGWRYRHWLGTDVLGRDVLSGLIYGTRTALLVGLGSMALAALIGLVLGIVAGYFGDRHLRVAWALLPVGVIGMFLAWFYGWYLPQGLLCSLLLTAGLSGLVFFGLRQLHRLPLGPRFYLPLDALVLRLVEVLTAIPTLLLLLTLIAILERTGTAQVVLIIGLLGWTSLARYLRAELLRIRALPYLEATRALGFSHRRILWQHALPNAVTPLVITLAFGIAGAILIESSLSFLGLGIVDTVTWGGLLGAARQYFGAWWLAVFPGTAIFVTVVAFNLIGEGLTRALDPSFG